METYRKPEFDDTFKVVIASPEVAPFAKTGGLADVTGSLPKALAMLGNDVRVILPRYRGITGLSTVTDFPVWVGWRKATAIVRQSFIRAKLDDAEKLVPVYFIDNYQYFDRDHLYGYFDESERFAFFSRAILETLKAIDFAPDILHLNDWQTGPAALLLKEQYGDDPFYRGIATVFTIHNLQYQGNFPKECLRLLGLGDEFFIPELLEFYGNMSFMKAGILYSDIITTVSKTYAKEMQTPEMGHGMDGLLRKRSADVFGIVNGINYHEFNPETDPRIYKNYGTGDLAGKRQNKYELQKEVGLPTADVPVIGIVSRLVPQKGFDLIDEALDQIVSLNLQLVILGKGEEKYEEMVRSAAERFPEKVATIIGFNAVLAQRIYAGSDMFLMPSLFEPCGLGQLISLRYGTIPIVRETGGLKDTIHDYEPERGIGNGFSFREYTAQALVDAIKRALAIYRDRTRWEKLVNSAMESDFSWNKSAVEYMALYALARNRHKALAIA
ncbi:MAG TPA: glycogen synthase GlgA [Firmicutes bacterium]|nr:glycogen synthase GlgA [Bacillota bacterium]